jgi:hypothetical protein
MTNLLATILLVVVPVAVATVVIAFVGFAATQTRGAREVRIERKTEAALRAQLRAIEKIDELVEGTSASATEKEAIRQGIRGVRNELERQVRRLALLSRNDILVRTSLLWLSQQGDSEDANAIQSALVGQYITGIALRREAKETISKIRTKHLSE